MVVIVDDLQLPASQYPLRPHVRTLAPTAVRYRRGGLRPYGVVTLVTLPRVTDAATMRKIAFWRYSSVNRQTLFSALACALLVFSMGCGSTNNLQSIQLSASLINGVAPTGQAGIATLSGYGGTIRSEENPSEL